MTPGTAFFYDLVALASVKRGDAEFVRLPTVCAHLGWSWAKERQELEDDPMFEDDFTGDGLLTLTAFPGWLFGRDAPVNEQNSAGYHAFRLECCDALRDAPLPAALGGLPLKP